MSYLISDKLKSFYEAIHNKLRYNILNETTDDEVVDGVQDIMNDVIANSDQVIVAADFDSGSILRVTESGGEKVFTQLSISDLQKELTPKEWKVRLTQSGGTDPFMEYSLIENLAYSYTGIERISIGYFEITFAGEITSSLIGLDLKDRLIYTDEGQISGQIGFRRDTSTKSKIRFETKDPSGNLADDLLNNSVIEILSYE